MAGNGWISLTDGRAGPLWPPLVLAGGGVAGLAVWAATGWPAAGVIAVSLVLLSAGLGAAGLWRGWREDRDRAAFALLADDDAAWFASDALGQVILRNAAAETRFGADAGAMLQALSRSVLDPGPLMQRLQARAATDGAAHHDIAVPSGALRLSVHRAGAGRFLWRVEDIPLSAPAEAVEPAPWHPPHQAEGADLEDVPVALMVFGRDGLLRSANRIARDMLLQGQVRAVMFHDLFDGLGRPVRDWLADVMAGRAPGGTEVLRARQSAAESFIQVTLHRFDDAGRPSALAVLNDATQLKTLEAQFVQSQKMQAIGQLAGGIAHDFNNLLTAISGHCDLLLLRHNRDDGDFADLEQIRQNANRAAALVGQLLAFSRKQTLQPERLDLEEVLAELTHLLNRLVVEKVGLKLTHRGPMSGRVLHPIRADRRQLEQVLINLAVNARDAMPGGGCIEIETEPVTLAQDLCRDRARVAAGDYSVIRIIDHGHGIPAANLAKIFEPFFTTKREGEGTGLGLSMAYGIVKQSGGFIFADSEPGKGSTFSLYFPAYLAEEVAPAKPAPARRALRQGSGVVLLVEDEASVRAFAGRALRLRGYTVLEAADAEEALKLLEDKALEVDIFVTDVMMPGMDGPTWVRQALIDRPGVRVVFVSGYAEDVLNNDQADIPNAVFLPKPFSLTDLATTVQGQIQ